MSDQPASGRKPRTRGNRDGRPFKHATKGWVAKAYYPNGKPKWCYGKTSKEAAEKRKKFYTELANEEPSTVGRIPKVGWYLRKIWLGETLPQRVKAGKMAQSTLDSYEDNCVLHIIPELGNFDLRGEQGLKPRDVRQWLVRLAEKPSGRQRKKLRPGETKLPPPELLSSRTIAYQHAILRKALADARKDEYVTRNVAALVDGPGDGERSQALPPTRQEAAALLAAAMRHRLWAYWLILLALGLRRGEGLGMRWSLTDLTAATTQLEESVQRLRGDRNPETGRRKGKLVAKGLKTEASKATVPLPPLAVEALKAHKERQEVERKAAKIWRDPDLIFATTIGTMLEPRNMSREWDKICEESGIDRHVTIHSLRHATGSYLFEAGVDLKIIQKVLRHTRLATTADIYTTVFEGTQRAAAKTMDGVLAGLGIEGEVSA